MTAVLWPDGPLPVLPHQLVPQQVTWWQIDAEKGRRHQHWSATEEQRDRWVRALEAAGWQVAITGSEEHRRYVTGGDTDLRAADGGPGGKDEG